MVLEGDMPLQPRQGQPWWPMLSGSALARIPAREGPQEQAASRAHQKRARQQREAPPGSKSADLCGNSRRKWWRGSD
eukprot:4885492-Pleurochrysis_carterae.AAC.1